MDYSYAEEDVITVLSFNLRRDFGLSHSNKWETRKSLATRLIESSGAAIIGVQEVLPKMRQDIDQLLGGYSIFGVGRLMGKNPKNDEHSDIILKNDDVEMTACKTFWISKKPDNPSRAYFAAYPRICTVAEIKIKKNGERIRVFNTHFDHICFLARNLGVRMILADINRINKTDPLPTIIMGDFNAAPTSRAVKMIREGLYNYKNVHFQDIFGSLDKLIGNTYHGFKGNVKEKYKPIDYIFVSDEFEVIRASVDTSNFDGKYPSDHYPISATLKLKDSYLNRKKQKVTN